MEYVSARFKAVTVKAGMQKPIKKETAAMKTTWNRKEQERWKEKNTDYMLKLKLIFKISSFPFWTTQVSNQLH